MKFILHFAVVATFLINGTGFVANAANAESKPAEKFDINREIWHATIAEMVAYQPSRVGFAKFAEAVGVNRENKNGREFYRAGTAVKKWAQVSAEGDVLKISQDSQILKIRLIDGSKGTFDVNGATYTYDPAKSNPQEFKRFIDSHGGLGQSKSALFNYFIPSAKAEDTGTAMYVLGFAGTAVAAGVTIAATVATGSVVAGAAVLASGAALTVGNLYCSMKAMSWYSNAGWSDYMNCMTKPLSWLGMNPRDNYFVESLTCESYGPSVVIKSATGKSQRRRFLFEGDKVQKFIIAVNEDGRERESEFHLDSNRAKVEKGVIDRGNPNGPGTLMRPKNDKELDEAQVMVRDAEYYQTLCKDPKRKAQVMRQVGAGNEKIRAHGEKTTNEMLKTSQ